MAETKIITSLHVVTDTETGQEKIGDIDGGCFDDNWLYNHVMQHGAGRLLEVIAWMTYQVVNVQRKIAIEEAMGYTPEQLMNLNNILREEVGQ